MSQLEALRALDAVGVAMLHASAIPGTEATLTDIATYTPPDGSAGAPITVLVDRSVQTPGFDSEVPQALTRITVFRVDVDAPEIGGRFTLASGESFLVDRVEADDESLSVCIVTPSEFVEDG
jgi:hypothetical protein